MRSRLGSASSTPTSNPWTSACRWTSSARRASSSTRPIRSARASPTPPASHPSPSSGPSDPAPSRRLLLVRVYPKEHRDSLAATYTTVDAIRRAAKDAGKAFPEFRVGVTGRPALEADEMKTTDHDSHRAEIVALTAVFVGLV